MNLRFFDWIWHIRGSVTLAPEQSSDDAFDRLRPLFREVGTSHERTLDTLTFSKIDPVAQDKMAVFDSGVLQVQKGAAGSVLYYHLTSRALLLCFLAPLLFLGFAQLTVALGKWDKPSSETRDDAKKGDKADAQPPMNPIDRFFGAPAPAKEKTAAQKAADKEKKNSPTSAYVLALLFSGLYAAGRILEAKKVKALFKAKLTGYPGTAKQSLAARRSESRKHALDEV